MTASEGKYRELFEEMRDALYLSDMKGRFVDVNKAMVELTGYESKEEMLKIDISRDFYYNENERKKVTAAASEMGYIRDYEVEIRRKDGRKIVVLETCRERRNEEDRLVGYEGIVHDITERKETEKVRDSIYRISEAVHSTRDFDELFHSIHEIVGGLMPAKNFFIALFDDDTKTFSLPYFADEYGKKPPSEKLWNGLTGYVLRTEKAMLVTPGFFNELMETKEVERISTPSVCWIGVPLKIRDKIIGVLAVQSYTEGITFSEKDKHILEFVSTQIAMAIERKRGAEELRISEESYRELFNNATDAIYIQDREGHFLDVNIEATRMYGYPREFFIGKTPEDISAPGKNDMEVVLNMVRKAFDGKPQQFGFWGLRKNGEVFPKDVHLVSGKFFGRKVIIGFARDITAQKRAEGAILQLNEVLRLINKIMRHDITNDLSVINGMLELYSDSSDRSFLDRAFNRIGKSIRLIRQMRELELLVSSGKELKEYKVEAIIKRAVKDYDVKSNITGDCTVMADDAFHSVIDNIIRNAVVHGKTDRIDITIENKDKSCEIRIADYGKGIPDEIKEKVFDERFKYGGTGGTGLGLYIVKKTIERYDGSIHIENNEPKGAIFVMELKK